MLTGNIKQIIVDIRSEWSNKGVKEAGRDIKKTEKSTRNLSGAFLGASLSLMFLGMAVQRVSLSIWKLGTKTFQDVMHSVDGTVTQFDLLSGSMSYLKFNVGQALEPLAASLIPIVDKLADWVYYNPELVEQAVRWGAIAGSILLIGGQIGTAVTGVGNLLAELSPAASKATILKNSLARMVATGYVIDASIEFSDGDITAGLSSALEGAGLFAIAGGKQKTGGALFALGVAVDLIDAIVDGGGKLTIDSLAKLLNKSAPGLFFVNPAVGAAALTIGVTLSLFTDEMKKDTIAALSWIFGSIVMILAALLETVLAPFKAIINTVIDVINKVRMFIPGLDPISKLKYYPMTVAAHDKADEFRKILDDVSPTPESSRYGGMYDSSQTGSTQEILIQLDPQATEEFLSGKLLNTTQQNMTGGY